MMRTPDVYGWGRLKMGADGGCARGERGVERPRIQYVTVTL
jgi:hypothetical protein